MSDIKENYPILIGVVVDKIDLIETTPIAHKFEQRSLQPVSLQKFTHIEVPLENIPETEKMLKDHNLSIPVLSLEYVDLYLADTPLATLAFSERSPGK